MVDQSDLPFRALVLAHGATLAYTQMLYPARLVSDPEYLAFHRHDLSMSPRPVVVQLCGNDPETILRGARTIADHCDGIDLNLGCPQEHAREGHYGAYLLGQKDWPLLEKIVSTLAGGIDIPVLVKLRLCTPTNSTVDLAKRLVKAGASAVALHARHASARRRRQGPAQLDVVKTLVQELDVPVISNGNVRTPQDVALNREYTGATGIMVGETLLANPYLFEGGIADPVDVSLEYLALCHRYPGTASLNNMRAHIRNFVAFQCERKPWYRTFSAALAECESIMDLEVLVRGRLHDWYRSPAQHVGSPKPTSEDVLDMDLGNMYKLA
ncbi:FMN-linked oxidoreductase [Peniophora sp. CONT]|nr:FMN-linked oxidoreductase [Peniophora sp. CONT]